MILGPQTTSITALNLVASKLVFTYGEPIGEGFSYLTRQAIMRRKD